MVGARPEAPDVHLSLSAAVFLVVFRTKTRTEQQRKSHEIDRANDPTGLTLQERGHYAGGHENNSHAEYKIREIPLHAWFWI